LIDTLEIYYFLIFDHSFYLNTRIYQCCSKELSSFDFENGEIINHNPLYQEIP